MGEARAVGAREGEMVAVELVVVTAEEAMEVGMGEGVMVAG